MLDIKDVYIIILFLMYGIISVYFNNKAYKTGYKIGYNNGAINAYKDIKNELERLRRE